MHANGGTWLTDSIDDLVAVSEKSHDPGAARPVTVVRGYGGSGRTTLLEQVRQTWADRAPVALVTPNRLLEPTDGVPRPFMSAVLLELGAPVTDYVMIAFPRVILAHIALAGPLTTRDPVAEMKDRIDAHTNTALLLDKMQDVLKLGSMAVARVSGATDLADPVIDSATRYLVDGIKRSGWLRRRNFGSALKWFAAQDPRPGYGEYRVLVRLNQQAWSRAAGQDVDDLLVGEGARLAQRDAVARRRIPGRPEGGV